MTECQRFPYPCVRCGVCCLSITCQVAQETYGIDERTLCPALSFNPDLTATCQIAVALPDLIGVGYGCCILGRAVKDGVQYDIASMPPFLKFTMQKQMRRQIRLWDEVG